MMLGLSYIYLYTHYITYTLQGYKDPPLSLLCIDKGLMCIPGLIFQMLNSPKYRDEHSGDK